ncbi:MAG: sugar O-acetyltransferase [Oscillospiraceae bacterium]
MDNITRRDNELPYIGDEACFEQMIETRRKIFDYNNTWQPEKLSEMLKNILGKYGENCTILPPFRCDYGFNISVGENFFANYNLTVLDVGRVTIGDNVMMGPNVSIYTAGHPVHYEARNTMYEYGIAVTIGDNCWIGGNAVICPGVTIGSGSVIGAGSVVTRDIPDNVIAAGDPCRVIREITDADKKYYFRDREFDEEAMKAVFGEK